MAPQKFENLCKRTVLTVQPVNLCQFLKRFTTYHCALLKITRETLYSIAAAAEREINRGLG